MPQTRVVGYQKYRETLVLMFLEKKILVYYTKFLKKYKSLKRPPLKPSSNPKFTTLKSAKYPPIIMYKMYLHDCSAHFTSCRKFFSFSSYSARNFVYKWGLRKEKFDTFKKKYQYFFFVYFGFPLFYKIWQCKQKSLRNNHILGILFSANYNIL